MKKLTSHVLGLSFMLTSVFSVGAIAQAATVPPTPVFYNQAGNPLNSGGGALSSGWYYNQSGQPVYYYGDGTYYNPETGTYYGLNGSTMSVANPSAGVGAEAAGSPTTNTTVTTTTVTAPNTGAGGEAGVNTLALILSGLVAFAGVTYLVKGTSLRKMNAAR